MGLTKTKIRKYFSSPKENASPLMAKNKGEKEKLLEELAQKITQNFKKFDVRFSKSSEGESGDIRISTKSEEGYYYGKKWYYLKFNSKNFLEIEDRNNKTLVYEEEQVTRFFQAVKEEEEEKEDKDIKTGKLFQLKLKTIESKVKVLAKQFQFTYSLKKMSTKIKLAILLNKDNALFIDIPYAKFQEVLPQLEEFIQTSLAFYNNGLKFTVRSTYKVRDWYSPE